MRNRPGAILLLMLFISQTVVMGLFGGRVMCFGSAHDHDVQAVVCESGCEHESSKPIIASHEQEHDDDCGCSDVDVEDIDLVKPQSDRDSVVTVAVAHSDVSVVASQSEVQVTRCLGPPIWIGENHGGASDLRVVRAARLLL